LFPSQFYTKVAVGVGMGGANVSGGLKILVKPRRCQTYVFYIEALPLVALFLQQLKKKVKTLVKPQLSKKKIK
jgi:hypothetical protein